MSKVSDLPRPLQSFIKDHPRLWDLYSKIGEYCSREGPLDDKTVQLIKMTIYAVRKQETPFKSHVKRAINSGASAAEIEHTLIQLVTAEGVSTTVLALGWASEVIGKRSKK